MSAQELITEHLDLWAGAVTKRSSSGRGSNGKVELTGVKKLQELILELAVRGKLVEQNPTDEPASKLLERVRAEKLHMVKQGKIKKRRKLPELSEMTTPFHLPFSWEWAQLEDVGRDWGQKAPSGEFSYIDVASVDNLRGTTTQPSILSADEAPSRARKIVRKGTLIYSTIRPYLQNIAVIESDIEPEPIASTAFAVLHPLAGMPARLFLHYLRSPSFVRYVESVQTGIAYPAINDKQFFSGLVPVPPLQEQHRIVQKVDELMALCDRLEQQSSDQLEAHKTLVDTLLGTLTQSENATELANNWARLAAHFDTLFTTEQSIDKLKQTILQLAVMGRLVEQDAGDEPAEQLIERIAAQKAETGNGKRRASKPPKSGTAESQPFQIPSTWAWMPLRQTGITSTGKTPSTKNASFFSGDIPFIGPGQVTASGKINTPEKHLSEEGILQSEEALLGDILTVCIGGSIGKTAIVTERCGFNQQLNKIRPVLVEPSYLLAAINADFFQHSIREKATGSATPIINRSKWESIAIPLAPLAEQRRIVQKVDELMALCDQIQKRLNQAGETRCQLAETVVENALH